MVVRSSATFSVHGIVHNGISGTDRVRLLLPPEAVDIMVGPDNPVFRITSHRVDPFGQGVDFDFNVGLDTIPSICLGSIGTGI